MPLNAGLSVAWFFGFIFYDRASTEIYTLSLHDALPISALIVPAMHGFVLMLPILLGNMLRDADGAFAADRKSTRMNSSHLVISYAVFCLKKKNQGAEVIE